MTEPTDLTLLPPDLTSAFKKAGWFQGRRVQVDEAVPADHPAFWILAEFGGLALPYVNSRYKGCEVDFQHTTWESSLVDRWAEVLDIHLIGIAETDNAHSQMLVDDYGRIFSDSLVAYGVSYCGNDFADAMLRIFLDERQRPMLLPDADSVKLYGDTYTRHDPEVLDHSSLGQGRMA